MIPKCNHCRADMPGAHVSGCLLEPGDDLTSSKYLDFLDITRQVLSAQPKRKTKTWLVTVKGKPENILGRVQWYPGWRCFSFYPSPETNYEEECLRSLAAFCESRTARHKEFARYQKFSQPASAK